MIVVTGATGNVGRTLVRALAQAGEQVTAASRASGADLTRPETLKPAFDGADAVFLMTPAAFLPDGDLDAVVDVARASGVRRLVLLSSQGVGTGRHPANLEAAVTGSGLEWTLLRPGNFASNTYAWADGVRVAREVSAPFVDVALPVIDPDDIAEVAAVVLREPGHAGATYELTGPAPISPRGQVAALADALGEPVRLTELSRDEARARMTRFMPAPVVESTLDILGSPTDREQRVSPDVERVLGRAPRPYSDWVAHSLAAFR
ncbi:NAD(P)H-binding protein [Actinokineospora sp. UTMC 2448]|uniref:NAD(P)H-binding protein n=1 Tax=Actinokineospora sp. UTMC 2448 TaxID=2268449 RepID=UPI00216428AE|nr:NAD(P)H-binding protein [Actinokineospora sp. UTMC 2448]UVS81901.1 NAD(P)H azoreductase [Actinokineospora sp. UTMC 2448]